MFISCRSDSHYVHCQFSYSNNVTPSLCVKWTKQNRHRLLCSCVLTCLCSDNHRHSLELIPPSSQTAWVYHIR